MTKKKPHNKLDELTNSISGALGIHGDDQTESYEYSASYTVPMSRLLLGTWEIIEHTVAEESYLEVFRRNTFRDTEVSQLDYNALYEFREHSCIKRVLISGILQGLTYHYRMNMVLDWSASGKNLKVNPLIGYQYSCVDGKPAAVQDLSPGREPITITLNFEDDILVLTDGNDIKRLKRISE